MRVLSFDVYDVALYFYLLTLERNVTSLLVRREQLDLIFLDLYHNLINNFISFPDLEIVNRRSPKLYLSGRCFPRFTARTFCSQAVAQPCRTRGRRSP